MTSLVLKTPTPMILARFINKSPEKDTRKGTKNEWDFAIAINEIGSEGEEEGLMRLIDKHHRETRGRWDVCGLKVVWDMPVGHEMETYLGEGGKSSRELVDALLWRKARDFLEVEYYWADWKETSEEEDERAKVSLMNVEKAKIPKKKPKKVKKALSVDA